MECNTFAYVGIDIGKKVCVFCIKDKNRNVLGTGKYDNTLEDATKFAKKIKKQYKKCIAACESTGSMWMKTFTAFESVGIEIQLANTYKLKIISETSAKTDKIDASKIADVLVIDMIPRARVATPDNRDNMNVLRARNDMTKHRTATINRTRDLLGRYDIAIKGSMYGKKALKKLGNTKLPAPGDNIILSEYIAILVHLTNSIERLDKDITSRALDNKDSKLLMSMTGIDKFGSLLLASEIGDIRRFATPKQLVGYAGLCPTIYQSGDRIAHGKMRKDCNKRIKWMMNQAANVAIQHDERMASHYESTKKRHGGKHGIAISHVATKMLTIIWHILTTRTPYSTRNEKTYAKKLKGSTV